MAGYDKTLSTDDKTKRVRIVHLSVVRQLTFGQTAQLKAEVEAAKNIEGVSWSTIVLQDAEPHAPFIRQVAWPLRGSPLRNLHGWIEILHLSRRFDYVLVRQMPVDIFSFIFSPFVKNRVTVHHSKEAEEHALIANTVARRIAAWLDRKLIGISVRGAVASLGVTRDIAEYESASYSPTQPISVYPNMVADEAICPVADKRSDKVVSAVFICGTFTQWHGLDRLIAAIKEDPERARCLRIHLVGKLSEDQIHEIKGSHILADTFEIHGYLQKSAYVELLEDAHVGIGSLALDRQNMIEGSSLKTAELLGAGVPVYATHSYPTVPDDFAYFLHTPKVTLKSLINFANQTAISTRKQISDAAAPYITKRKAMLEVADFLQRLDL